MEWVIDQCEKHKWGDLATLQDMCNGFIEGWNHVARRVTTQRERNGEIIAEHVRKAQLNAQEMRWHDDKENDQDNV